MTNKEITAERQHDIRYHVQQCFIPDMAECVMVGYLPYLALFPSAQWYTNLMADYDIDELKAAKVWENFEKIDIDEDAMIILYTFPQPEEATEALYGAVLFDPAEGIVRYYTLEATYGDKWAVCHRTTSMHSLLEIWESADKDKFVEWVENQI
jgi:hypothetical protein